MIDKILCKEVGILGLIAITFLIIIVNVSYNSSEQRKKDLGEALVKSLYQYNSLEEFDSNISVFKSLVTESVFTRMTADNSDRVLRIYLKFNAKPCQINIIESNSQYIIYSLVSEAIEPERVFILVYETDIVGKISAIREAELFSFPTTREWDMAKGG